MSSMSNMARDTVKDAKDAAKETAQAASAASGDIKADLEALRDDVARLTQQIADILADKGGAAWHRAKSNIDGVISDVENKGMEAVDAVRDASDHVVEAIDESIKTRPYTTLAIAFGLGFLFGVTRR
jgi:ElaB/YqjD/DUF883 family membrane-anchored ribosome-binding protein